MVTTGTTQAETLKGTAAAEIIQGAGGSETIDGGLGGIPSVSTIPLVAGNELVLI